MRASKFQSTLSMAYFFANQGTTYTILRDQGYMFTTPKDAQGRNNRNYAELANMQPGDRVILNNNGLVAVGTVKSKNLDASMEEDFAKASNDAEKTEIWKEGKPGCRVEIDLELLPAKIRYQDFRADIEREQANLPRDDRPFNRNGVANQSTFWYLTPQLGELLFEMCGRREPRAPSRISVNGSAGSVGPPSPQPYVPQFEQRELRPEQAGFRKLMIETWGGVCPITGTRHQRLLEAAHFKDWRHHNGADAGMLLDARVHAALDAKLLTIALNKHRIPGACR
jgi:hypothetical protein